VTRTEASEAFFDAARSLDAQDVRIIGTMLDPYRTDDPVHLDHHTRNRRAGRLPGNVTIQMRYQDLATGWFSLLWASVTEPV
jgi:hypothetical protein